MTGPGAKAGNSIGHDTLINGVPGQLISCADRGLLYGDGLFETIAVRAGRPCLWQAHLERLAASAARLSIPMPDPALWRDEAMRLLAGATQGTLKLILTRGPGPRGYRAPAVPTPTRLLIRSAAPQWPEAWLGPWSEPGSEPGFEPCSEQGSEPSSEQGLDGGVEVILCRNRLGTNPGLAGIKHLNRLEQVLARAEWDDPAIAEGLMLDQAGRLVCGTMTNLFLFADGALLTPRLTGCGVAGTLRAVVIQAARGLGLPAYEADLWPADLARADGAFLTNALIGLWPIRRVGGRSLALAPWSAPSVLITLRAKVMERAFTPGDYR